MVASNLISTRIALDGAQQIIAQLRGMGAAGEAAIRQIQQAATGTSGPLAALGRSTGALRQSVGEVNGALGTLANNVGPALSRLNRFTQVFGELRGAIGVLAPALQTFAGVGVIGAVVLAAVQGAKAIDDLNDSAQALGVTLDQLQSLQAAAATQGIDIEKFTRAFELFTTKIGAATRAREEFSEKATLKAQEEELAQFKAAAGVDRAREAVARANREQEGLAAGYAKARLEADRLSTATDKYTVASKKQSDERAAQGTRGIALGQSLEQSIKESEAEQSLQQSRITASEAARQAQNRAAEGANNVRAAQMRLSEAYKEQAITIERNRLESEKQRDSFEKLGVDITKGPNEAFIQFIERMEAMTDVAKRNSYLRENYGRGWVTLAEMVSFGSKALREFQGNWDETFVRITEGDTKLATDFQKSWGSMIFNVKQFSAVFGNLLGPALTPIFDGFSRFLKSAEENMREFTTAFVTVMKPIISFLGEGLGNLLGTVNALGRVLRTFFTAITDVLNIVFGWKLKDSELIAGTIVWYGLLVIVIPRIIALGAAILGLLAPFARVATVVIGLRFAFLPLIAIMTGPVGFVVAIAAIVATMAAFDPVARGLMGGFFKFMGEGWHNLIETIKAGIRVYEALYEVIQRVAGASAGSMAVPPTPKYARDTTATASDVGARVRQENPDLYRNPIARAFGGLIPGRGRGDHVPVLAEPGEYMVSRNAVSRVGLGFMNALNNGAVALRMAAGGLVDGMASTNPAPVLFGVGASPAAASDGGRALFHLTIGDRTFRNLSAPETTAREMQSHARSRYRTQMGPAQGWKK